MGSNVAAMELREIPARRKRCVLLVCFAATAACGSSLVVAQTVGTSVLAAPPERVSLDENNVDVLTGSVSLSFPLLSIGSGSYGLQLDAYFNSQGAWRDSFSGALTVTKVNENTSVSASWGNEAWTFPGPSGSDIAGDGANLQPDSSLTFYQVTDRDGAVITYSLLNTPQIPSCADDGTTCTFYYFPTQAVYPNGVIVTVNNRVYVGNPLWMVRVQSVTSNTGYQIKFNYQANDPTSSSTNWQTRGSAVAINNGTEYCDPMADTCSLSGNWPAVTFSNGIGTHTVTDALGRSTRFTYGQTSLKIKTAASSTDNVQYVLQPFLDNVSGNSYDIRVTSATIGSNTWNYAYAIVPANTGTLKVTSTDPQTHQTVYMTQAGSVTVPTATNQVQGVTYLGWVRNPLNTTTTFTYACQSQPNYFNSGAYGVSLPEGNAIARQCDVRGNVTSTTLTPKPGSGLANILSSATFPTTCLNPNNPKTCNKPTAVVDGRGLETDYTYDSNHGGVLTETLPAAGSGPTGSVRPQKRYSYAQFYAYVKNSAGNLVQAASPVWLPTQISECRTLASCAGGSDEVLTTYEYAPAAAVNRLLVRGKVVTSGGVSLRTCYAYDSLGNQTSVTAPRAALSACP
jgi:hypothetical protein